MSDLTEVGRHAHKKKKRRYEATNEAPEGGDVLEPLCYDDEIPEVPKKKKHKKRHTESESVGKELSPVSPLPDGNVFSEKKHKKKHTHQSADEEINLSGESSNRLDHLEEAGVKKKKKKKQHNNYDYDDDDGHGNAVPASLSEENGVECNDSDILEQEPPQPCKKKKKKEKKKQSSHAEEGNMDENVMPAEVNVHVPKKKRKKKHQEEAFSEEIGESTGNEPYHQSAQISNEESGISERNSAEDAGTNAVPKQKMKDKEETAIENVNDQPVQQDSLSLDSELINEESLNVSKKKKRKKLKDIESNVSAECTPPAESVSFNDGSADGDASGLQDDNTLYKRKKAGKKNHRVHFSGAEAGHNSEEMLPNDEQDTFSGLDGNGTDFSSVEMGGNIDGVVEEDHDLMETENSDAQKQLQKKKKHKKKHDRQSDEPLQPDEPENYYELARSEDITSDYLNSASAAVHHELKDDTKKGKKRHKDRKDHAKNTDCTGIDGNVDKAHSGSSKEEGSVPGSRLDHGDTSIQSRPHAKKKKKRSTANRTGDSEGFPLHKHKSKKKRKKDDIAPNEKASSKDMHKKKKKRHNETKGSLANAHSQNHTKKHKKKHKREHSKSVNSHKNTKRKKKKKKESENQPEDVEPTSNSSFIDDIVDGSEGIEDPSTTAFISKVLGSLDSYTVESGLDTSEEPPDFEVPLLHATGSVKPLPKKEKESLLAQGVTIRNGRWTKAERSILMKNWEDFAENFKVEDPGVFLGINQSGSDMVKIRKFNAAKHFYVRLARDLNERTLYSVYRQARQLLHPHRNSGKFSENDVNTLNMLRNLHGNQWSKISEVMDKPAESCRGSFRIHKEGRKTGAWSNEERDRLKKAVERFTKEENVQNSPNSSQNIPWEEVAKRVETRNSAQCREQWYKCKSFHVDKQQLSEWGEINEACLIYLLYHNMVEDEVLVNWRALFPAFRKCLVSYKGLAKKWFFIKRKVTDYKSKTHSEIVTHLYTKHLPYLISRLGTSMSHLESLANQSEPTTGK